MVNNEEFKKYLEEAYWWRVDSSTKLDGHAILIELTRLDIIDHSAEFLEDGYPPRKESGRIRLYRIAPDSPPGTPKKYLSEEFAKRCRKEHDKLGYPVMLTCQGDDSRDSIDWLIPVQFEKQTVFIKAWDMRIMETVKAFALAFNRKHTGAWEYLAKGNVWSLHDEEFLYTHNYSGEGVSEHQDLSVQLVQLHARVGDVTPGLFMDEDGVYVPMVMNENTREGFEFSAPYGRHFRISVKKFTEGIPVILLRRESRMENMVPETLHDIIRWSVQSTGDFVIDVDIASTPSEGESVSKRYRLPIGDLRKNLRREHSAVLICQSLDMRSTQEKRAEKRVLFYDKEKLERFWTEKIFCNPWVDAHGNLRFLNGATFPASWIVRIATYLEDS